MPLRNGEHGYGAVTKTLHWLTFLVVVAQFVVGYTMETDDSGFDRRDEACEATVDSDAAEAEEERCEEQVEAEEEAAEGEPSDLHVALGIGILVLASLRVLWRAFTPLPPWSPRYTRFERRLQGSLERVLIALLFAIPVTGLLMGYGVDAVAWHVAAHVAFFVAVGLHVALQLFRRHLPRML